uniref:Uncharacterized protein n=1 Tax=Octopus bimaculoides TaxID=37653 RepID=A0A0L8H7E9_OCTBM
MFKKQADTAKKILVRLSEFKSKIFYLSDIFKTVNLQSRKSDLVTCSQKIKGYMGKLKISEKTV